MLCSILKLQGRRVTQTRLAVMGSEERDRAQALVLRGLAALDSKGFYLTVLGYSALEFRVGKLDFGEIG